MTTQDFEQRALALPEQARQLMIENDETFTQATDFLLTIKALRTELDQTFDPVISKAHAAHKEAVTQKKRHEEPLAKSESIIKHRLAAYHVQQEQQCLVDQRKAQEAAQLQEAIDAEARGDQVGADAALNGHGVVAVTLPPAMPKVEGVAFRESWEFEIADASLLPRNYLLPDMMKIGQVVRAMKHDTKIPGVKVFKRQIVAAGVRLVRV